MRWKLVWMSLERSNLLSKFTFKNLMADKELEKINKKRRKQNDLVKEE